MQRTLKVALSHRLRPSLGLTTTLSELCRANLPFLYSCTKRFNSMRRKGKKNARELLACTCVVQTEIPRYIVLSGCQFDDRIFQSGLNFSNLTFQVVEMCIRGPFTLILLFDTIKFAILRLLWKWLGTRIVRLTLPK